ncbi:MULTISPECIES: nucleotidyltransferase domain-containing protein [Alphaproteobacteria]|uniref:Nucleotidyltransferase n=2 Tax=Alphaproteobacteria TaxID=28211 RepID=A0A512HJC1_9HYPH|nr:MULTISPECIES: nucleotidyltransferase [Alphaproteobacteria]GEO85553.1 nucleotidyltransferase [Ciceribacter naphthalenivorans]GLR22092.1 nucleotidyltransferase [Ciceribacter naphthalenivorans]GLT04948.1 nucleotidyltransferase [Sphingomonas psychrolutea]
MNIRAFTGIDPFHDWADAILAQIAFKIQLPPSLHAKAVSRYEAVRRHLEATTFFADGIEHFYPQGSMAIDATISTRGTDDEYDIDIIAQLDAKYRRMGPLGVLKALEDALSDYPVQKVIRQTRCVTLVYSDKMHLDVSTAFRQHGTQERRSHIMHAKGPNPGAGDCEVPTNAYGFAEHYKAQTPIETAVSEAFQRRWNDYDRIRADAEVDDVPNQTPFVVKNMATLALQLVKRYRNINHDRKHRSGRMAPSILLAHYAARSSRPGLTLSDALISLCVLLITDIRRASLLGHTLTVFNPTWDEDEFTDRWPGSVAQQDEFADDLVRLVNAVRLLKDGKLDPTHLPAALKELFGDFVVTEAIRKAGQELGGTVQRGTQGYTRAGGIMVPAAVAVPAVAAPKAAAAAVSGSRHTFFGDPL